MTRSVWKGPFVDGYLLKKAEKARGFGAQRGHQDLEPPLDDPAAVRRPDLRRLQRPEAHPGATSPRTWSATSSASSRRRAPSTATRRTRRRRGSKHGQAKHDARARGQRGESGGAQCCASARRSSTSSRRMIRGKKVEQALAELEFSRKRIADDVRKCLESAIANAENNHDLDVDELVVLEAYVGKALVMKRFHARAPRPRRPDREAVLEPHDRGSRSRRPTKCGVKERPRNGSEGQSRSACASASTGPGTSRWFAGKGEYGKLLHEDMRSATRS